ncbi:hypothetical protein [Mycoplasmopsis agassizii]|uniref:Lipoprotein n=1 Tax=Mycoplasmopsis agassizii TaxID=33922 RepID=A0ABX4H664_9BACT|nr:hypothetical protein [Mycoplasmopsis agassizii]PAF55370.1 hypothetical protein CJF60_01620 [Mycoplasmopsis agassizii]SMC20453.1 hypothetical protein SAMN02745179_01021 [Mycoplasmopsis agassizii]
MLKIKRLFKFSLLAIASASVLTTVACSIFNNDPIFKDKPQDPKVEIGEGGEKKVKVAVENDETIYYELPEIKYTQTEFTPLPLIDYIMGIENLTNLDSDNKPIKDDFIALDQMKSKYEEIRKLVAQPGGIVRGSVAGEYHKKLNDLYSNTRLFSNDKGSNMEADYELQPFFENFMNLEERILIDSRKPESYNRWSESLKDQQFFARHENFIAAGLFAATTYSIAMGHKLIDFYRSFIEYRLWMLGLSGGDFETHFKSEEAKKHLIAVLSSLSEYLNVLKSQWLYSEKELFINKFWEKTYTKIVNLVSNELSPLMQYAETDLKVDSTRYTNTLKDLTSDKKALIQRAQNLLNNIAPIKNSTSYTADEITNFISNFQTKFTKRFRWNF